MANTPTTIYGFNKPASGDTPWATTANNDIDSIEQEIARQRLPFLSPTVGATTTCDLNQTTGARGFTFTVSQATTLAFTNVPSSSFLVRIMLIITNGAAFTLTWPASVTWIPGVLPTLKTAGVDIIELFTVNGGTTWYGAPHLGATTRVNTQFIGPAGTSANPTFQTGGLASGTGINGTAALNLNASTVLLATLSQAPNRMDLTAALIIQGVFGIIAANAALATTATDGFFYAPSCAGPPTGVPTAQTGTIPLVVDSTNGRLYARVAGAWKSVLFA